MSFFAELKRRKVIRVGIAYVIGAWLLLQLTEVLSELLNLPQSVGPVVVALVAIGLPIALLLAWAFELTSEGLKRDSEVRPEQRGSGRFINTIVLVLLIAALGYFVWESRFRDAGNSEMTTDQALSTDSVDAIESTVPRSIAVLPFENFSGDPADAYFADGLADTLLHKLAQIQELKVIARNSSFQFKGSNKDVREIGQILGVETVLEGSVQKAGDQVRVIVQLVETTNGVHIWSETFDDTMENIFALQDRISSSIVNVFEIELSRAQRDRLLRSGTDSTEAYELILRAKAADWFSDKMTDVSEETFEPILLTKQAIELDPEYALAWTELAGWYNSLAFATESATDYQHYVSEGEKAARRALEIDPELAAAHTSLGWMAHRKEETLQAIVHFRKALEIEPNYGEAMSGLALQLMRTEPEEALQLLERSQELGPTATIVYRQKHFAYLGMGEVDKAIEQLHLAVAQSPDSGIYYKDLADIHRWLGRPDLAAETLSRFLERMPESFMGSYGMAQVWGVALEHERAGRWIELSLVNRSDSDESKLLNAGLLLTAGQFEAMHEQLDDVTVFDRNESRILIMRAWACMEAGQMECAQQQVNQYREYHRLDVARGSAMSANQVWLVLTETVFGELSDPGFDSAAAMRSIADMTNNPWLADSPYVKAGIASRMGDLDGAMAYLDAALGGPDGDDTMRVDNIDDFGLPVERSLLLNPLRDQPGFSDWLGRYQQRRDDMLQRMITMESRGEIISVDTVRRMIEP